MPLYEYECDACGHRLEIIQKFSDGPPDACPKCGKGPLQRQQSSPAFQFKGTGWYVTDYAGKGKDGSDKGGGDKGDGDKGGESKPAEGKKSESGGSSGESGGGTESKKSDAPASRPRPPRPRRTRVLALSRRRHFQIERFEILPERHRQVGPLQREVDERLQEPELVPGVVAHS